MKKVSTRKLMRINNKMKIQKLNKINEFEIENIYDFYYYNLINSWPAGHKFYSKFL